MHLPIGLPSIVKATRWMILAVMGPLLLSAPCLAQKNKPVPEYIIKSALMAKFLKFVEWPENALAGEKIIVLVIGENPVDGYLQDLQGKIIKGHPVEVIREAHARKEMEIPTCHMIFIGREERKYAENILDTVKGKPILTVGEFDGFVKDLGGMVNFVLVDNNIRLQINQREASEAGLRIPSTMLRSAIFVVRKKSE